MAKEKEAPTVKIEEIETTVKEMVEGKKVEVKLVIKFDRDKLQALVMNDPRSAEFALAGWKIALFQKQVRAFLIAGFGTAGEILPMLERKLIPGITACHIKE